MESLIEHILRPLRQFFARTVFYIVSCEYYVRSLESEARWLKSQHDDVRREVSLAERQGMEPTNQVRHWMDNVTSLLLRADGVVAEFPRVGSGRRAAYRLSKRADEARAEAVTLFEQRSGFQRVADAPVFVRTEVLPVTTPLVGLDALLARLQDVFQDTGAGSITGIYGMPGVGKTTLLHHFNNTFLSAVAVSMDIHLVIYVEVTERCSMAAVQDAIGARLGLRWEDNRRTTKDKALALFTYLHKWNFVLLLDDVWEPLNLAEVGVPVPGRQGKSKVLLTTRFEQVCDQMDAGTKIKMDCLAGNDPWELFQHKVGNVLSRDTKPLAQAMATRCGGLPLALIAVARAMACKKLTQEWEHGMTVLSLAPWQLEGFKASLLTSLKRSYDSLRNESLKSCLLYSSLFTGDLLKEALVECLIGEGFVSDFSADDLDNLYNKGHYMLGILLTSSLLEAGGDDYHVKMHPMVRAMALWVSTDCGTTEDKCLVRTGLATSSAPPARKWVNAERVSLTRTDIREMKEAPACSFLKTLLLRSNRFLGRICHGFFGFMPCLRLLDLSDTQLATLPSEINLLVSLQYLSLSNTIIRSLPDGLGALVNLRFLLLSNVPVQSIAVGVLNSLTALQVLCMDQCYSSWMEVDIVCGLESGDGSRKRRRQSRKGVNLRELESLKSLHILDIAVQEKHSLQKLSQSPHLAERLRNLHIEDCGDMVTLRFSPSNLWKRMNRLKRVSVTGCCNLETVFFAGGEYSAEENWSSDTVVIDTRHLSVPNEPVDINNLFSRAATMSMKKKKNATCRSKSLERAETTAVALLPSLQTIVLHDLPKLAKIVWQRGRLEHLCSLNISSCNALEQLVSFGEDRNIMSSGSGEGTSRRPPLTVVIFPNLKELELQDLPNMKSISPDCIMVDFPNLEELKVVRCDHLKKLKLVAGSLKDLQCTQSWWNKLEWDNENHKSFFLPSVTIL